ncbi:MAG TPA: hypothetical protein VE127_05590 [Solirubrobacteraceae bacterium]|nr:hypothetical protein [Solirubrobacteraceae bacterium]
MDRELERRVAANEDIFRRVNEGIERGRWPNEPDAKISFRCECARLGCNRLLSLTRAEYEGVRAHPRHFVLLAGHELPALERVIDRRGEILIVEKTGEGGEQAESLDRRS